MRKREERTGSGFGRRLRELRDGAGLAQEALAQLAGVSSGTVAKIEQGKVEPMWPTVLDLSRALGVEVTAFLPQE